MNVCVVHHRIIGSDLEMERRVSERQGSTRLPYILAIPPVRRWGLVV